MAGRRDAAEVLRAERLAVQLRLGKTTYDEISEQVTYSDGTRAYANKGAAQKAVTRALLRDVNLDAGELRREEIARIDAAMKSIWNQVLRGNLANIDRMVTLQRQLCRFVPGLEAPEAIEHSGSAGTLVVQMQMPEPDKTIEPEPE